MAQYYTKPPRNASRDARPSSIRHELPISARNSRDRSPSFYIFPNPSESTSPSSTRSPGSPSTEVTLSPYSDIPSIEGSSLPTPTALAPVRGRENVLEWPKDLECILVSPPRRPQLSRTSPWTPRVTKKPLERGSGVFGARGRRKLSPVPARESRSLSGAASEVANEAPAVEASPNAGSHVPFLSFFTSLLSTDHTTHDMIMNSSVPSLFHTTTVLPRCVDIEANLSQGGEKVPSGKESHGIGKFVVSVSEEGQLFLGAIKSGSDIPAFPVMLNLSDVLGIVTEIGGQLLRVAFRV